MDKCQACGSEQLSIGQLVSTATHLFVYGTPINFKPPGSKGTRIMGIACLNCGHLELKVNQEKLLP